jgi:tetratricopeptide (TPR) repeat protein
MQEKRNTPLWVWGIAGIVVVALVVGLILAQGDQNAATPAPEATGDVAALVDSGRQNLEEGAYNQAIADLEAAVTAAPDQSQAHFLLGQAYNHVGRYPDAAEEFTTVLDLDPENAAAHHNLGVTYFQLQDPNAAVEQFQAALAIDPDDADTHYQLGATYLVLALSAGNTPDPELMQQAVDQLETALSLKENMPEALIGLGNIYIQQGNLGEAVEMLRQAIEQLPQSPEAHYALARAYAQQGDLAQACETYEKFLTLNAPSDWQMRAQEEMNTLGCSQ